jgi:molecular chaperone GrpE
MSTDPENNGAAEQDVAASAGSASEPAKATEAGSGAAEPTIEQKLADAIAESGRMRDQWLRTAADFDNFRKRTRKAEDDALRRGREQMLKELLPVFDNLERGIAHADAAPDVKSLASGLRMVVKQLVDTLEKVGVKRIVAVGQPFDPSRHEAIQHLESAEHPAGVVVAEVQPGYVMGETLVRPTMVVVSKGVATDGS